MNKNNSLLVASRTGSRENGKWGPIGRLEYEDGIYRFVYTRGAKTLEGFRPFHGMDNYELVYESDELFPIFANRLLSKSRPEYESYLRWSGFDPNYPPDPISILGVTEGIRQTDAIEVFPCPVPDVDSCYLNKFFLHSLRWMPQAAIEKVSQLTTDEPLYMMLDVCNKWDAHAVALRTSDEDRFLIGYVPRYLAQDAHKLLKGCNPDSIQVFVDRVNFDAPLQQRLLCRIHACWPEGFLPCADEAYLPIPAAASIRCGAEAVG